MTAFKRESSIRSRLWGEVFAPASDGNLEQTGSATEPVTLHKGETASQASDSQASEAAARRELEASSPDPQDENDAGKTGSLLLVVVYGGDGSPAQNLGITVLQLTRLGPRLAPRRDRTDANGTVQVASLQPGEVYVSTDLARMKMEKATIVAGQETKLTITLEDGIDVTGIVVDADGVAVAGATIVITEWAGIEARPIARSNAEGQFRLRQVGPTLNLGARAKGYAPSPLRTITAGKGATVEVRIVLPGAGGAVRGRVLDPSGQGVPDGRLEKQALQKPTHAVAPFAHGPRAIDCGAIECAVRHRRAHRLEVIRRLKKFSQKRW